MFSDYASRFLSQSQAKLSKYTNGKSEKAPLFYSAADYLQEEDYDDGDGNGLPPPRSLFGSGGGGYHHGAASHYELSFARRSMMPDGDDPYSSGDEGADDTSHANAATASSNTNSTGRHHHHRALDSGMMEDAIKSSWNPPASSSSTSTLQGMQTIGLDDTTGTSSRAEDQVDGEDEDEDDDDDDDDQPPEDIAIEQAPPPFQVFNNLPSFDGPMENDSFTNNKRNNGVYGNNSEAPLWPRDEEAMGYYEGDEGDAPQTATSLSSSALLPVYDGVWGKLYIATIAIMFATAFLIWLRTTTPSGGGKGFGESVYPIIHANLHTLIIYTLIATIIALGWIYLMAKFMRQLMYVLLGSVPLCLLIISIYPTVMSYRSAWGGNTLQDHLLRWSCFIPFSLAIAWIYLVYKNRHSLEQAVGIVKLSCRILTENPALIPFNLGMVISSAIFAWIWLGIFTRVFLKGHMAHDVTSGNKRWIVDSNSWILAIFYVLELFWTFGVLSGIQRATTAAVVSQWYFHRHGSPQAPGRVVLIAALSLATTVQLGTICLSSLLALLIRVPLIILPSRIGRMVQTLTFQIVPVSLMTLTNPLTLCFASITSNSLSYATAAMNNLKFIDLGPDYQGKIMRQQQQQQANPWAAYRLSKLLLSSVKYLAALSFGYCAWIHAISITDSTGSLYGYIVGFLGGIIGYIVLASTEGSLGMIVDGAFVCFAVDQQSGTGGGHCREADCQFGGPSF